MKSKSLLLEARAIQSWLDAKQREQVRLQKFYERSRDLRHAAKLKINRRLITQAEEMLVTLCVKLHIVKL
jgi:hypothetical protein